MNSRNVSAVDEATELRNRVVRDLENMSYAQLQELSATLEPSVDGWATLRREKLPSGAFDVHALICKWGLVRRRISVELTVTSEDGSIHPGVVPCVYFERFASGRMCKPGARGTAVIIGVALALLAVAIILLLYFNGGE